MGEAVSSRFKEYTLYSAKEPWRLNVEPFRLAPNIYYVGNEWVGAFLVDTAEGLILIDTVVFETVYLTLENIRSLGFDPYDIRHIMLSHMHIDHAGGVEAIAKLTGAKVWLSKEDAELRDMPGAAVAMQFNYMPYEVDEYYEFDKPMNFGDLSITPVFTPGHTPGTTSFIIEMKDENGEKITAAIHGGVGPLTMTNAVYDKLNAPYSLRKRFIEDCDRLKNIHIDIAIPSHPSHGNLFARFSGDRRDYHSFIDAKLWPEFLEERKNIIIELDNKEGTA